MLFPCSAAEFVGWDLGRLPGTCKTLPRGSHLIKSRGRESERNFHANPTIIRPTVVGRISNRGHYTQSQRPQKSLRNFPGFRINFQRNGAGMPWKHIPLRSSSSLSFYLFSSPTSRGQAAVPSRGRTSTFRRFERVCRESLIRSTLRQFRALLPSVAAVSS